MADYARMRGCSRAAVTQAVKRGQIALVNGLVDVAAADEAWPPTAPRRPSSPRFPRAGDPLQTSAPPSAPEAPSTKDRSFWDRRGDTEAHRARLLELELQQRLGLLLDRKEAELAVVEAATAARMRLEMIADSLPPMLVGKEEPEIHRLLKDEIHAALTSLDVDLTPNTDI